MLYDFGSRLLKLRKDKNLTQQMLADRAKALSPDLRLSDSVLGKYESDLAVPRLTEAAAIADVLNVSLDYLACGETYRSLSLKGLSNEQVQLMFDLAAYLRQAKECKTTKNKRTRPTEEQVTLIARLLGEIMS